MYNRYIPQPDGSYRRSRMPEAARPFAPPSPPAPPPKEPPRQASCPPPEPPKTPPCKEEHRTPCCRESGPDSFLRQLLPKDFDTGDLIVVLLLLLMAGDCETDRNNAILTIALYFMM